MLLAILNCSRQRNVDRFLMGSLRIINSHNHQPMTSQLPWNPAPETGQRKKMKTDFALRVAYRALFQRLLDD
jgi:hypothetical protein